MVKKCVDSCLLKDKILYLRHKFLFTEFENYYLSGLILPIYY